MRKLNWQMICFILFISVFLLVGFGVLSASVYCAFQSSRAAKWPTTPGVITQLGIHESTNSEDGKSYEVQVAYAYMVGGVDYSGSRLAFGYTAGGNPNKHEQLHNKLKEAKSVDVRYNPADPADSCLSHGFHRGIQIGMLFSLAWLTFVIASLVAICLAAPSESVLLENLSVQ